VQSPSGSDALTGSSPTYEYRFQLCGLDKLALPQLGFRRQKPPPDAGIIPVHRIIQTRQAIPRVRSILLSIVDRGRVFHPEGVVSGTYRAQPVQRHPAAYSTTIGIGGDQAATNLYVDKLRGARRGNGAHAAYSLTAQ
jgi:hypothetical protein